MKTIKNILVPTNLSISSLSVVEYAIHQFNGYAFNITLLHVLPLPDSISDLLLLSRNAETQEKIPAEFHSAIERLKLLFPLRIKDVTIEHQYGLSSSILSQIISEKQIDLILHCKTSFKSAKHSDEHKLLKLLDESVYPVVYIPESPTTATPKNISFVLEEDINSVEVLQGMLEQLNVQERTEIRLVAAMKINNVVKLLAQVNQYVDKGKLFGRYKFSMHVLQGENYEDCIMQFTEDFEVDMVFLLKKKTFLNRYFINQHILNQTLKQARIPLFTLA